jgi:hypothetical protein
MKVKMQKRVFLAIKITNKKYVVMHLEYIVDVAFMFMVYAWIIMAPMEIVTMEVLLPLLGVTVIMLWVPVTVGTK